MNESYQKLIQYALGILAKKRYTESEMMKKLEACRDKNSFDDEVGRVMARLRDLNYLNDFDYATHHVSDRVRFRPRGEYMLRSELKLKGLDEKLVDKVLAEAQIDEAALAYDLLMKKSKRWKNDEPRKRKDKAYRFLASRGFALDAIYKAIKRCYDPSVMSGSIY